MWFESNVLLTYYEFSLVQNLESILIQSGYLFICGKHCIMLVIYQIFAKHKKTTATHTVLLKHNVEYGSPSQYYLMMTMYFGTLI